MKKFLAIACSAAVLAALSGCSSAGGASTGDSSSPAPAPARTSSPPAAAASPSPSPSESSAVAEGFPADLIPLYPDSEATATSFAEDGTLLTASLTASSAASPEEVAAFYTQHFEGQGFTALEGDAVGSALTKDLARSTDGETETVNVSVVTRDGQSVYTVGANVLPASAEQDPT